MRPLLSRFERSDLDRPERVDQLTQLQRLQHWSLLTPTIRPQASTRLTRVKQETTDDE